MSKFNSGLNPYLLSPHERMININGPQCAEMLRWFNAAKKQDPSVAHEGNYLYNRLLNGPMFEEAHPMVMSLTEINLLCAWKDMAKEGDITEEVYNLLKNSINPPKPEEEKK